MGIEISWEDENGTVIEILYDMPGSPLNVALDKIDFSTVCLSYIDPYGDTTFNQLQIPVLIEELEILTNQKLDVNILNHLAKAIAFIRKAEGKTHTYIKFIGD